MLTPALFLDRDGVINADHGYVHRTEEFEFLPGIFDVARFATATLGWPVVVVTNQSGIGRGYYSEADFAAITAWMTARFADQGAPLARVYHCPYHPKEGIGPYRIDHPWRKPRPGMLLAAAEDLGLDLALSAIIGDSLTDMEAGAAAGLKLLIHLTNKPTEAPGSTAVPDLGAALQVLKAHYASRD